MLGGVRVRGTVVRVMRGWTNLVCGYPSLKVFLGGACLRPPFPVFVAPFVLAMQFLVIA